VYLKVESSWASSTGTYAIKYFEEGDAVVSLSAGNWVNASITESGEVDTYTFTAQSGTTYNIYWADSSQYGAYNPTPTCNISVTAYQSDLATTFFADQNSAFTTPKTISGYTGTVYLKVKGDWPSTAGTYAIRYTTP
jgi:hypothetical protein